MQMITFQNKPSGEKKNAKHVKMLVCSKTSIKSLD